MLYLENWIFRNFGFSFVRLPFSFRRRRSMTRQRRGVSSVGLLILGALVIGHLSSPHLSSPARRRRGVCLR